MLSKFTWKATVSVVFQRRVCWKILPMDVPVNVCFPITGNTDFSSAPKNSSHILLESHDSPGLVCFYYGLLKDTEHTTFPMDKT